MLKRTFPLLLCFTLFQNCEFVRVASKSSNSESVKEETPPKLELSVDSHIYVSPTGTDLGPGSKASPLRTISAAKQRVRNLRQSYSGDITVSLRGGVYELNETLSFTPEDSAPGIARTIYQSYPGETAILSGGISGHTWTAQAGNTYLTNVGSLRFRQIYASDFPGLRPMRARFPKAGDPKFKIKEYVSTNTCTLDFLRVTTPVSLAPAQVDQINGSEMVVKHSFSLSRVKVDRAIISGPNEISVYPIASAQEPFGCHIGDFHVPEEIYFENKAVFITEVGEWSQNGSELLYKPRADEVLSSVVLPRTQTLIKIEGTLSSRVQNLTFQNLEIRHTNWNPDLHLGKQGGIRDFANFAALEVKHAHNIEIKQAKFAQLGASGLLLGEGTNKVTVKQNNFEDIAGNAIVVRPFHLTNASDPNQISQALDISDNLLQGIGLDYAAIGIFIGYTKNSSIKNNRIRFVSYAGISIGWFELPRSLPAVDSTIEANDISDVMQRFNDGGGIYTIGQNLGLQIRGNYLHDFPFQASEGLLRIGIYIDGYSSDILVTNNFIRNLSLGLYLQTLMTADFDARAKRNTISDLAMTQVDTPIHDAANVLQVAALPEVQNVISVSSLVREDISAAAGLSSATKQIWKNSILNARKGLFRANSGIHYSFGSGYCTYASFADYQKASGNLDPRFVPTYQDVPATLPFSGSCPIL